jgi:hypothetical protein
MGQLWREDDDAVIREATFYFSNEEIDEVFEVSEGFYDRDHLLSLRGKEVEVELCEDELIDGIDKNEIYGFTYDGEQYETFGIWLEIKGLPKCKPVEQEILLW